MPVSEGRLHRFTPVYGEWPVCDLCGEREDAPIHKQPKESSAAQGQRNDEIVQPPNADADVCHIPWSDRFAIWRTRWFPYRTHEWLGPGRGFSRPVWQWPDVLGREFRD